MTVARNTAPRLGLDLLARVAAAGLNNGFRPFDVVPCRVSQYAEALDNLIDMEFVERVVERCGRWFYRVTPAGAAYLATGKPERPSTGYRVRRYDGANRGKVYKCGGGRRTNRRGKSL